MEISESKLIESFKKQKKEEKIKSECIIDLNFFGKDIKPTILLFCIGLKGPIDYKYPIIPLLSKECNQLYKEDRFFYHRLSIYSKTKKGRLVFILLYFYYRITILKSRGCFMELPLMYRKDHHPNTNAWEYTIQTVLEGETYSAKMEGHGFETELYYIGPDYYDKITDDPFFFVRNILKLTREEDFRIIYNDPDTKKGSPFREGDYMSMDSLPDVTLLIEEMSTINGKIKYSKFIDIIKEFNSKPKKFW